MKVFFSLSNLEYELEERDIDRYLDVMGGEEEDEKREREREARGQRRGVVIERYGTTAGATGSESPQAGGESTSAAASVSLSSSSSSVTKLPAPSTPLAVLVRLDSSSTSTSTSSSLSEEPGAAKRTTISIDWSTRLPFSLGLCHQVEVQVSIAKPSHPLMKQFLSKRDQLIEEGALERDRQSEHPPLARLGSGLGRQQSGIRQNQGSRQERGQEKGQEKGQVVEAMEGIDRINQAALLSMEKQFRAEDQSSQSAVSGSGGGSGSSGLWAPFTVLASKSLEFEGFGRFILDTVQPGAIYSFRIRYRISGSWSAYSHRSSPIAVPPSAPSSPASLRCELTTASAACLSWAPPLDSNGCEVREYILYMKQIDNAPSMTVVSSAIASTIGRGYVEVYRGRDRRRLVTGMSAETSYGFTVCAVTLAGTSKPYQPHLHILTTKLVGFRHLRRLLRNGGKAKNTKDIQEEHQKRILDILNSNGDASEGNPNAGPALGEGFSDNVHLAREQFELAMNCREAWRSFWDSSGSGSGRYFYFNVITSVRTLERPQVLGAGPGSGQSSTQQSTLPANYAQTSGNSNSSAAGNSGAALSSLDEEEAGEAGLRGRRTRLYARLRVHLANCQKSGQRLHNFNIEKAGANKGKGASKHVEYMGSDESQYLFLQPPNANLEFDEDFVEGATPAGSNNNDPGLDRSREGVVTMGK